MLSTKAKSLEYSTLKDSGDVLRRVPSSDDAKKWINDMVRYNTPCYLVIGIQTLCMAEFTRVVLREGVAGGYITVPLEAGAQWTYQRMKGTQQEEEEELLDITLEAVAMDEFARLCMDAENDEDD
ncbi:hypothetical protein BGX29_002312 [Mortierella sp. GBA35]|nr:hypothetical protein BGX29_002312 [Mortierella sp. GBA35]